ncbi:MAG: hypothetical protein U0169_27620 [Polyangiaceae bacterium]
MRLRLACLVLVASASFGCGSHSLISESDTVTVGWRMLGTVPACGKPQQAGIVRIDFPAGTVTRLESIYRCTSGSTGAYSIDARATHTMTPEEKEKLLRSARSVTTRDVDECLGFDGKSFFVQVAGGAAYTDGISSGCGTIAEGHDVLYSDASSLVP